MFSKLELNRMVRFCESSAKRNKFGTVWIKSIKHLSTFFEIPLETLKEVFCFLLKEKVLQCLPKSETNFKLTPNVDVDALYNKYRDFIEMKNEVLNEDKIEQPQPLESVSASSTVDEYKRSIANNLARVIEYLQSITVNGKFHCKRDELIPTLAELLQLKQEDAANCVAILEHFNLIGYIWNDNYILASRIPSPSTLIERYCKYLDEIMQNETTEAVYVANGWEDAL